MSQPEVTIVTPTKNRLRLLCQAIDSVQSQTFENWEHIIVDDGSDDGTAEEIIRRAERDGRLRYISRSGQIAGSNICRNIGIAQSRADLIIFLDSDDLLRPHCVKGRVEIMRRNLDVDFVTFATAVFKETPGDLGDRVCNDLLGDDLARFLYFECPWIITAPIWRKAALLKIGVFDEVLPSWQDIDLHVRAIANACKYLRYPDVDHDVRWQFEHTKVSVMQRRSPAHFVAAVALFDKFERAIVEGPGMNWVRQRALCGLYFFVAEMWLEQGNIGAALRSWAAIRQRALGSRFLFVLGTGLLLIKAMGTPGRIIGGRLAHKWKGWARMRTNPELVAKRS